jgi:CHAD domain-containing protein
VARKLGRVLEAVEKQDAKTVSTKGRAPARGWKWALDARIAHRATSLRLAVREAGAVYLPDRLHGVRIAVKKLRYALELSVEASGATTTSELRALKRSQELLGRLNDLHVLMERVRQIQASLTPPNVGVWRELDALTTMIENSCRRLHARYMGERAALEAITEQLSARPPRGSARAPGAAGRTATRRAAL